MPADDTLDVDLPDIKRDKFVPRRAVINETLAVLCLTRL